MITLRTLAEQLIRKGYTAEQAVVLAKRTYRRDGHGRFSSTGSAPAVRDQSARERNRFPQYAARGSSSKSPSARLYGRLLSKTNTQRMHLDAAVGRHLSERVAETVSRGLRKPRNRVEQLEIGRAHV